MDDREKIIEEIADMILDIERMRGHTIDVAEILSIAKMQCNREPEPDQR